MITAGAEAQAKYDTNYAIAGKDGVHPGWAGHTVMGYAFLKALGMNGEIGTYTVHLKNSKIKVSKGHEVIVAKDGEFEIKSSRYPFCACEPSGQVAASYPDCEKDDVSKDTSIRSAMTLIPFNQELNRLMLVVADTEKGSGYRVEWGGASKEFTGEQLRKGINLAAEFPSNPFSEPFAKVDAAVAAKQVFETKQIKQRFHGSEGKTNLTAVVTETEKEREPLAEAIKQAFVPVTHKLKITRI
jgi:hypothetical protein